MAKPAFSRACATQRMWHLRCGSALSRCEVGFADRVLGFGMVFGTEREDLWIVDLASVLSREPRHCAGADEFPELSDLIPVAQCLITHGRCVRRGSAAKHLATWVR